MLTIRLKDTRGELQRKLDKELVDELRGFLPPFFKDVADEELASAYHRWSEENYCAGWIMTDEGTVGDFLDSIELIDENGDVFVEEGKDD